MLTYTRGPDFEFTHFVSVGDTTIDNWLETVRNYCEEGVAKLELYDYRQQTNLFTNDEIDRIIELVIEVQKLRPPEGKTAILVNKEAMFGLARMYDSKAKIHGVLLETEIFYEQHEAFEWLGQGVAQYVWNLHATIT